MLFCRIWGISRTALLAGAHRLAAWLRGTALIKLCIPGAPTPPPRTHTHTHTHRHTHTSACARPHTHQHTHPHACAHTHRHTHTLTHTHMKEAQIIKTS